MLIFLVNNIVENIFFETCCGIKVSNDQVWTGWVSAAALSSVVVPIRGHGTTEEPQVPNWPLTTPPTTPVAVSSPGLISFLCAPTFLRNNHFNTGRTLLQKYEQKAWKEEKTVFYLQLLLFEGMISGWGSIHTYEIGFE